MNTKERDWAWEPTGTDNAVVYIGYSTIGGVYKGGDEDTLSHSDARLIAAAPELLEALRDVMTYAEKEFQVLTDGEHGTLHDSPAFVLAHAAIAKAIGGAS